MPNIIRTIRWAHKRKIVLKHDCAKSLEWMGLSGGVRGGGSRGLRALPFEATRERLNELADLVADSTVMGQGFVLGLRGLGELRRVVEADVDDLGSAGEDGAGFVGVAADGDDVVEWDVGDRVDMLGRLRRDVDAGLGHDLDGGGVHAV